MKTANQKTKQNSYIGEQIRRQRKLKKITQKALAAKAGVTPLQMRQCEWGRLPLSADVLCKVAETLDTSVETFFPHADGGGEDAPADTVTPPAPAPDSEFMARQPVSLDVLIGAKIRQQRKLKKITQQQLGEYLGVTFQQIQKYEKGVNRTSLGSLIKMSEFLGVPVAAFYPKHEQEVQKNLAAAVSGAPVHCTPEEGNELMRAFMKIPDVKVRRKIIDLAKALSDAGAM